jgi:dolichol kinase
MPNLAPVGIVFALLLLASLLFTGNMRRRLTILTVLATLCSSYVFGSFMPELALGLFLAGCFAVAFASLETKIFPLFAAVSGITSAMVLVSGVTPAAVSAGFLSALLFRYLAEWFVRNLEGRIPGRLFYPAYRKSESARMEEAGGFFEYRRKGFHFFGGMAIIAIVHFLGREASLLLLCSAALLSLFVINSISLAGKSIFEPVIRRLERHGKRPLDGVLWFFAGTIILLLFAKTGGFLLAGIFVMAAGDAGAAIVGKKFGSFKWPHNKKKSIAGTFAFVACSLPALLFANSLTVVAAIALCAILESFNWNTDDNIIAAFVFAVVFHA